MRLLRSIGFLLILVGVALAVPAKRKLEKKSISNGLAPKTIEPVDQKLDEPIKLSDEALMEVAGENVDRAKKQVAFCVEIRQNKPTQVDCDELNNRPIPPPPPPPAPIEPEPQEPLPPPPPPPPPSAPAPVPQQQPDTYSFEFPCEPEIAAFYVQPPGEIVYAPTGKCAPHLPTHLHLPSGNPSVNVLHLPTGFYPAGAASGSPSINLLHLPSGSSLPSTGHGLAPTIHIAPSSGSPTVIPLHTTGGGAGIVPTHTPSSPLVHVIRPSPLHHHGALPLHGLHGTHHLSGIDCTCTESLAKSTDGSPPSNEALAMKFLQDMQRNNAPSGPSVAQMGAGQPASPMMTASSGSPAMAAGQPQMRYMPHLPMSHHNQHLFHQQHSTGMHGIGGIGMHGYPIHTIHAGMYPGGMIRSHVDCLQDSFGNSHPIMPQGLRLSREQEAEASSGQEQPEQKPAEEKPAPEGKPSRSDFFDAMKKQSTEGKKDEKNSRIARYLMEKNVENNVLDEQ